MCPSVPVSRDGLWNGPRHNNLNLLTLHSTWWWWPSHPASIICSSRKIKRKWAEAESREKDNWDWELGYWHSKFHCDMQWSNAMFICNCGGERGDHVGECLLYTQTHIGGHGEVRVKWTALWSPQETAGLCLAAKLSVRPDTAPPRPAPPAAVSTGSF